MELNYFTLRLLVGRCKLCIELNFGRVMASITQLKSFLIDVIIRNQDIKKLEKKHVSA